MVRVCSLAAVVCVLAIAPVAASDVGFTTLLVEVRPEAVLASAGPDALRLTIRLAPDAQARLWIADNCLVPAADAYVVSRSARYVIELAQVPGHGASACLASSDNRLAQALPIAPR